MVPRAADLSGPPPPSRNCGVLEAEFLQAGPCSGSAVGSLPYLRKEAGGVRLHRGASGVRAGARPADHRVHRDHIAVPQHGDHTGHGDETGDGQRDRDALCRRLHRGPLPADDTAPAGANGCCIKELGQRLPGCVGPLEWTGQGQLQVEHENTAASFRSENEVTALRGRPARSI
eukprot:s2316_g9.t2